MLSYNERNHQPPVEGAAALELRSVTIAHYGSDEPAVQGASLAIYPGELVALIGPNGAGKSSIMKAVAGLVPIITGQVRVFGRPIGTCHHRVTYLPQRSEIDWRFPISVERLVLTGRYVHLGWLRRPGPADTTIVRAALAELDIADLADRQIGDLSGGQQQRALLARALVQQSDLLLLDEPTNAVDSATRELITATLRDQRSRGRAALVATHDREHLHEFDRVIALQDGQIVIDAPAASPQFQEAVIA